MKKLFYRRLVCLTLSIIMLISAFSGTVTAAENAETNTEFIDETLPHDCAEHVTESFATIGDEVVKDTIVTLSDTKETLISSIKSSNPFTVNGTVTSANKTYNLSEYDFSKYSKYQIAKWAYNNGWINEEEKLDCYCDLIISGNFENQHCLNNIITELNNYTAAEKVSKASVELSNKISEITAYPQEATNEATRSSSNRPTYNAIYESSHFSIHFTVGTASNGMSTSLTDAVNVANYFEYLRTTFYNMGFNYPILDTLDGDNRNLFNIYLASGSHPTFSGICYYTNDINGDDIYDNLASQRTSWSYIVIYNFDMFRASERNYDELQEIFTHEFFHSVQNAHNKHNSWFKEASANWAVTITTTKGRTLHNSINNFIYAMAGRDTNNLLLACEIPSLVEMNEVHEYGAMLYPMAMQKLYGNNDIIRQLYINLESKAPNISLSEFNNVITNTLTSNGSSETFESIYRKMTSYICNTKYWYEDIWDIFELYDIANIRYPILNSILIMDSNKTLQGDLNKASSYYYELQIPSGYTGEIYIDAVFFVNETPFFSNKGTIQIYNENSTYADIHLPETVTINSSASRATYTISSSHTHDNLMIIVSNTSMNDGLFYSINVTLTN